MTKGTGGYIPRYVAADGRSARSAWGYAGHAPCPASTSNYGRGTTGLSWATPTAPATSNTNAI